MIKNYFAYRTAIISSNSQIRCVSEFGHTLKFDESGHAICFESQQSYCLINDTVVKNN